MAMLNERADEVWERVKEAAFRYASMDRPLPGEDECAEEIERILRSVYGPDRIPQEAFDFYVSELCAMIEDDRRNSAISS